MKQFNTWERYFDTEHPKHKFEVMRHNWIIDRVCGERILDVGCGDGLDLFLAGHKDFTRELHGIDIRKNLIDIADRKLVEVNKFFRLTVADVSKIPMESNYFDCVICGETLEHVSDDKAVVDEMLRVLSPGGTLIVSVPDRGHLSKEHIRLYDKNLLSGLIGSAGVANGEYFEIREEATMPASLSDFYLLLRAIKI